MAKLSVVVLCTVFTASFAATVISKSDSGRDCVRSSEQCYDQRLHPDIGRSLPRTRAEDGDNEQEFWLNRAKTFVANQLKIKHNTKIAKNVIFFLGDGMSVATIAATRVYMGGEAQQVSFEKFPYTGLSKTYCVDKKVPDSACTATAYLTGVKGNYGTIGVNAQVQRYDCNMALDKTTYTSSIAKWAQDAGKSTGIVTTTRITHASPAGTYAHIANRDWESDGDLPAECPRGIDIATQLIHGDVGSKFKVILGGGRREFLNASIIDDDGTTGRRQDGKNLINEWLAAGSNREYVFNRAGLNNVHGESTDSLLGLFQDTHMLYHLEAQAKSLDQQKPTLEEMTRKAIEILQKDEHGFFLFVEGGKIDLAHHDVYAKMALDETVEFSKAIQAAVDMINEEETLIVVTSDHAHTMSISGYPQRGNDILGPAAVSFADNVPYMTLSYANGDGFETYMDSESNSRLPPVGLDADDHLQKFPSTVPIDSETHGGEDVGVFAKGPWAHLFTSTYEQNQIPHLMAYAACIGNGLTACDRR